MKHPPLGLGWPENVVLAAQQQSARDRAALASAAALAAAASRPPPIIHIRQNIQPPVVRRQQAAAAAAALPQRRRQQQRQLSEVITIDDSDHEDEAMKIKAPSRTSAKGTKRKAMETSNIGGETKKKKSPKKARTTNDPYSCLSRQDNPIVHGAAAQQISGQFVTGVLSGRLLELEKESNQKRALGNILQCCVGPRLERSPQGEIILEHAPAQMTLSLAQAKVLANGFLTDRNRAVSEAVRIAYMEMQGNYEEILGKVHETLREETAKRRALEEQARINASIVHGHQVRVLERQALEKDAEIASLKKELKEMQSDMKSNKGLQDDNARLKEKLRVSEKRQAHSVSAFVQASVHSLRALQRKRNASD